MLMVFSGAIILPSVPAGNIQIHNNIAAVIKAAALFALVYILYV